MAHWQCYIAGYPTDATLGRCCRHYIGHHRHDGRLKIDLCRCWIGTCDTSPAWLNATSALVNTKPLLLDANTHLVNTISVFVDAIPAIVDAISVRAPDAIQFLAITMNTSTAKESSLDPDHGKGSTLISCLENNDEAGAAGLMRVEEIGTADLPTIQHQSPRNLSQSVLVMLYPMTKVRMNRLRLIYLLMMMSWWSPLPTISTSLLPGPLEDLSHQAWFFSTAQRPSLVFAYMKHSQELHRQRSSVAKPLVTPCVKHGRPPHNYQIRDLERLSPGAFERKLKEILPMRLSIVGLSEDLFSQLFAKAAHLKVDVKTNNWELITDAVLAATSDVEFHFTFPQRASYISCHF
ncbi:hypothetical protein PCANC_16034 [Puccinia coronata f. sp. avenae]|uniref:Uncharacterized protein n=1 Tax=Puccinia coronata f. sp. avenae TaxID=200324 RepID=A0A2N5ULN3_9BASI|nr:hypothetical protein PCANC_16034 [Puccinia coronata f. sp. avenae]